MPTSRSEMYGGCEVICQYYNRMTGQGKGHGNSTWKTGIEKVLKKKKIKNNNQKNK